jgi:hypothetical protein
MMAESSLVLRAIDKLDKFGPEGVLAASGEGRKDESGDFTKGAGWDADQTQTCSAITCRPARLMATKGTEELRAHRGPCARCRL